MEYGGKMMKIKVLFAFFVAVVALLFVGCNGTKSTTIVFVTYTGNNVECTVTGAQGVDELQLPEVSKDGYVFGGWYFDAKFNDDFSFDELKVHR